MGVKELILRDSGESLKQEKIKLESWDLDQKKTSFPGLNFALLTCNLAKESVCVCVCYFSQKSVQSGFW